MPVGRALIHRIAKGEPVVVQMLAVGVEVLLYQPKHHKVRLLGTGCDGGFRTLEHIGLIPIVGVGHPKPGSASLGNARVAGSRQALVLFMGNDPYALVFGCGGPSDIGRPIGRAVIYDDKLPAVEGLPTHARNCPLNIGLCAINRHDDRDERGLSQCGHLASKHRLRGA